ncbi:MAG: Omp28-related outer membrane protein [Bacteroidales bacterium]|nr:Omp28-related outer membrane protein [Bacteroidales bacterium]
MRKLSFILVTAAMMLFVSSCDKIDINNTHKPFNPSGHGKTVLIKDFTGVRCVNCPAAAETVHELQHELGEENVFIMSVHAGYLAQPVGQFPDFTTPEGTAWYGSNSSNPLFSVDHVALTDGNTLYVEQVDIPLADALAEEQSFEILQGVDYDDETRQLNVEVDVVAIAEVVGDFYVTACLLEDSIVGRQVVPGGVDTAYVFRNVFRGTVNGVDGDTFFDGPVYVNDEYIYRYSIELDPAYNADQCYFMSYIYDKTDGKILQTALKKIK